MSPPAVPVAATDPGGLNLDNNTGVTRRRIGNHGHTERPAKLGEGKDSHPLSPTRRQLSRLQSPAVVLGVQRGHSG